jgi:hypothetical protein
MSAITLSSSFALSAFPGPLPPAAPPEQDSPDRATTFQAVQAGGEHHSGEVLLVMAYGGLWAAMMLWVVLQWRKQAKLGRRIDALEAALAASAGAGSAKGSASVRDRA